MLEVTRKNNNPTKEVRAEKLDPSSIAETPYFLGLGMTLVDPS